MAHLQVVVCTVFLFLLDDNALAARNGTVYVITSEQQAASLCPVELCYTFNKLVGAVNIYSLNFTRIAVSPGIHVIGNDNMMINRSINEQLFAKAVLNVEISRFEYTNESLNSLHASIKCVGPFGFLFSNITNLTISNITFNDCSCRAPFDSNINVTLFVIDSVYISIVNITISGTEGIGLLVTNVQRELWLSHSNFYQNDINCFIRFNATTRSTLTQTNINIIMSTFSHGRLLNLTTYFTLMSSPPRDIIAGGLNIKTYRHNHIRTCSKLNINIASVVLVKNSINLVITNEDKYSDQWIGIDGLVSHGSTDLKGKSIAFSVKSCSESAILTLSNSLINETASQKMLVLVSTNGDSRALLNKVELIGCFLTLQGWVNLENIDAMSTLMYVRKMIEGPSQVTFCGQNKLHNNSRLVLSKNHLSFGTGSKTYFINNIHVATYSILSGYSILFAEEARIRVWRDAYIRFENNTSISPYGGAITAVTTQFEIIGPNAILEFIRNKGTNGAAMYLYAGSQLSIQGGNLLRFIENSASLKGGAIYVDDPSYTYKLTEFKPFMKFHSPCPKLEFVNNTAKVAGDILYGGWIDLSGLCHLSVVNGSKFNHSFVSSNPTRVCMCRNSTPDCSISQHNTELFPGKTFQLQAVAVGQRYGIVPAVVQAQLNTTHTKARIDIFQNVQTVNRYCTTLSYTVYSVQLNTSINLSLTVEYTTPREAKIRLDTRYKMLFNQLTVTINVSSCPLGFSFGQSVGICICHPTLVQHDIECNMTTFKIKRSRKAWIYATKEDPRIIVSKYCPYNYCYDSAKVSMLDLNHPDQQCASNRSGILCGRCRTNYSQMLGTSSCIQTCSNKWIFLIIPVFAIAGVALIVFLVLLNLTASIGTINGLIFYANIVRANHAIFFPPEISNSFLSWFIAWLNLDLGIEVCFYNGLDGYAKAWLQFLFPVYIWFIVITIILLSRRYFAIAKLCGNNTVQVLATLFLLSYAKLLRNIITVFQSSTLTYSDNYSKRVWLHDGNIDYLTGKHIPLFIIALLVLILLSVPYTTVLLVIQWLQKINKMNRILFWVHRFKPLFDAYTGPYKEMHRYWTGLLLLIRGILILIFSLNTSNDPFANLLVINITVVGIISYMAMFGWVYESKLPNFTEVFFLLNLGCLTSATFYQLNSSADQVKVTYSLVGIVFLSFVAIVMYHMFERMVMTRNGGEIKKKIFSKIKGKFASSVPKVFMQHLIPKENVERMISHSSIQLREALLANEESNV